MLSQNDRGVIETIIDLVIKSARVESKSMQDTEFSKQLHVENVPDFVFGMAIGEINMGFSSHYKTVHNELLGDEGRKEVSEIIIRRLPEIRQAIYFEE